MRSDFYYTVEQIADMLQLHPKTVQRYIREGKLHANKLGKSWRISGHDLSVFTENENVITAETNSIKPFCKISSVVDIGPYGKEDAVRLINGLTSALNTKERTESASNMQAQYLASDQTVRITLWGSVDFIQAMLQFINGICENRRT